MSATGGSRPRQVSAARKASATRKASSARNAVKPDAARSAPIAAEGKDLTAWPAPGGQAAAERVPRVAGAADNAVMLGVGLSLLVRDLAVLGLLTLALAAQVQGTRPGPSAAPGPKPDKLAVVVVQTYSEARSRTAFAAIDRNADDRIDIFEFARAEDQGTVSALQDPAAFRITDEDHSGFLDWPEFDRRLRSLLRLRGEFRYRPARVLPEARAAEPSAEADVEPTDADTKTLLKLLDTDRSGRVSREEFTTLLSAGGMPAATMVKFVDADANGDDQLDAKELSRLLSLLPGIPHTPPAATSSQGFAPAWRRADRDGDGEVSVAELEVALRAHDIYLGRWTERIVGDADRSGDHRLGPAEVLAADRQK